MLMRLAKNKPNKADIYLFSSRFRLNSIVGTCDALGSGPGDAIGDTHASARVGVVALAQVVSPALVDEVAHLLQYRDSGADVDVKTRPHP